MRFSLTTLLCVIAVMTSWACNAQEEPTKETFKKTGSSDYDDTVERFFGRVTPKILGGKPATPGAYPWQVSLVVSNIKDAGRAHFCGGTVYNDKWIVTAAHCMTNLTPTHFQVVAGTYKLDKTSQRHAVKRRIIHADYEKKAQQDSDVALIELVEPLQLTDAVKPLEILGSSEEADVLQSGKNLVVTGWGATVEGGDVVRDLREVGVPFITGADCADPLMYGKQITDTMICAGDVPGKDSCQGDSGGPIVPKDAPVKLVGIVSWGEGCARPGKPGVYTRVSRFKDWIEACTTSGTCPEKK
jgi:secreted trypsin-like serine protease